MFSFFYNHVIFIPLYNGLIGLIDLLPWIDAGIAVILFTLIVRLILFPLSKKAVVAQVKMRELQPKLDQLKIDFKDDKHAQSLKMMELYKENKVNPFSSILLLFIQLPIMYALYAVFIKSGLPVVNPSLLYTFVSIPTIHILLFGLIDVTKPSIILSIGAALAQYFQLEFSVTMMKRSNAKLATKPVKPDAAQNMTNQMKYIIPVMIFILSYRLSGVLALYWITTNIFTLLQELVVRHRLKVAAEKVKPALAR